MKNEAESCQPVAKQSTAGNTSVTGTNVLNRTKKNTPQNEGVIRGVEILPSDLPYLRRVLGEQISKAALEQGVWVVV